MPETVHSQDIGTDLLRQVWVGSFDGLPPNPNRTRGQHWGKIYKEAKEWKEIAGWVAKTTYKGSPLERASVHYQFSVGDNRVHDLDNLIASMKPVQDGLKGIILVDDSIDNITVSYGADRNKPRGFKIIVRTAD